MFSWFKSLFTRKVIEDRYDLYKPAERIIYQYYDGTGIVRADPLRLYKRLKEVWPELSVDLSLAESISKDADKGYDNAINKIKKIFEVESLDKHRGGLTDPEIRGMLDHFLIYCETVKKNLKSSVTPSPAASPNSESTSAEKPPTSNSSDSGLTESAPDASGPNPSPMESQSHSESPIPETNTLKQ